LRTLQVEVADGPDKGLRHAAPTERLTVGTADGNDVVLHDPTVSRFHLELRRRAEGVLVTDTGSTNGTWCAGVRIERGMVSAGAVLRLGATALRVTEGEEVDVEIGATERIGGIVGRSAVMRRLMRQIERAAQSDVSVLIVGESGTGKEVIARALHDAGARASRPFVTLDCGAIAPTLVASELFGHERGAFTGADRQHIGAFERADGGTVFLDEIGELPPALQPALLGVLERRRFRRLGGKEEVAIDVRLVCATNRDLRVEVNAGRFRLDLYYRVAQTRLEVPPLRERREDIPLLAEKFLEELGHDGTLSSVLDDAEIARLGDHPFAGNVRELRNIVEAAVAMGEMPPLERGVTAPAAAATAPASSRRGPVSVRVTGDIIAPLLDLSYREARGRLLASFEERYLRTLLERSGGVVSRAARTASMNRSHLIDLLQRHGIKGRGGD
jgi:DNA-binding NtrC family response regulator